MRGVVFRTVSRPTGGARGSGVRQRPKSRIVSRAVRKRQAIVRRGLAWDNGGQQSYSVAGPVLQAGGQMRVGGAGRVPAGHSPLARRRGGAAFGPQSLVSRAGRCAACRPGGRRQRWR